MRISDWSSDVCSSDLRRKQHTISVTQVINVVLGKTTTLESDDIQAGQPCPVAHHRAVWNDVVFHARQAADHGMAPDPHELMHSRQPADDGEVVDDDMSGERGIVRHDDVIADDTVMRDMGDRKSTRLNSSH